MQQLARPVQSMPGHAGDERITAGE